MSRVDLGGFVPAVVTPFTPDGEIMEDAFVGLVDYLLAIGARAICVAGDNGESWTLDILERHRLTELAVARAGSVPIIMGVTAPGARQTVAYARAAKEAGAAAVLAMPQTYVLNATRDELLRRFEALGEVGIPVVAYNSPRRSGINISIDDVEAIMGVAPLIGIKESSRDFFHHTHLLRRVGGRIAVMTGPSHYILPCAALGASGFIATGPELLGAVAGRLTAIGRAKPDATYIEAHNRLTIVYELLMASGTWPAAFKAALNLIGLPAGVPRDPVLPLGSVALEKVRATLDELGLIA